ncbi:MAG: glycosyltransferase [Proteobacteria bacterium]|nr:glycosyltransferase [Pseudomonadota bacterium]
MVKDSIQLANNEARLVEVSQQKRPWIVVAAYDVSLGDSSEGYVALNILHRLAPRYRIILVTRCNNRDRLLATRQFSKACPGVRVIGFDLPKWARWWKRGARFYGLYAYLWQLSWPVAFQDRVRLIQQVRLLHVLNFHNDSIPSFAWMLRRPVVWGPINHHEPVPSWRREFWPVLLSVRHRASFLLRQIAWRIDPFLQSFARKASVILSAGPWVDRRLRLGPEARILRLSQLGVSPSDFPFRPKSSQVNESRNGVLLVHAGRLDWLKGVDLAIEALAKLPEGYRLLLIGKGPAESRLRALAEERGLKHRVEFRQPVPRAELARIYEEADLFLFTSPEVAGLAWIEALACGLPVAGFSGETEFCHAAEHLPAIFVAESGQSRQENINNLAATIVRAFSTPSGRTSTREAALARYGWSRMVSMIETAYSKALDAK